MTPQWITYHFFEVDGMNAGSFTFGGNARQRRVQARSKAKALAERTGHAVTFKVWKHRKGEAYTSGSFNK